MKTWKITKKYGMKKQKILWDEKIENNEKIWYENVKNFKKLLHEKRLLYNLNNLKRSKKLWDEKLEQLKNKIKEYEEKLLYNDVVIIQCFTRISLSKKKANDLRSIPDNLFDPEFSLIRKKMFNIDDSCFKL